MINDLSESLDNQRKSSVRYRNWLEKAALKHDDNMILEVLSEESKASKLKTMKIMSFGSTRSLPQTDNLNQKSKQINTPSKKVQGTPTKDLNLKNGNFNKKTTVHGKLVTKKPSKAWFDELYLKNNGNLVDFVKNKQIKK